MEFKMPVAKRERLEELLEYLGDTRNYSDVYDGNRAEDFKKCVDVESEWCWKYADIVLRGLENRPVGPGGEGHHGVPRSFYGVKRNCRRIDAGNWFKLSYAEHLWAHYCMVWCATGKMRGKMARAFITMYKFGMTVRRPLMPSEAELLDAISDMELRRIRAMEPQWAKVEAEGRTHHCEDPKQHYKDYYEANREKIAKRNKAYREANKEMISKQSKSRYEENREKLLEQAKAYRETNKEKLAEKRKAYREANKEKISERNKAYYEVNKEKLAEQNKAYREVNKEKLAEKRKAYYEANKEKIIEKAKVYHEANRGKIAERHKSRYEANRDKLLEQAKAYYEANKEKIIEYHHTYRENNRDTIREKKKAYYDTNRGKITEKVKAYREAKKAAGYRKRKDPETGKCRWVFVGIPESKEVA